MSTSSAVDSKVFVVTGATSGIGEGIVKMLSAQGGKCVFCGRRKEKGQAIEESIQQAGGEATFVQADVLVQEQLEQVFKTAEEKYGGVDVFVANAGIEGNHAVNVMDDNFLSTYKQVMGVNIDSVIATVHVGIPYLEKRGQGVCFVMSSVNSSIPVPGFGSYCIAKAGCDALVRCLAAEVDPSIEVYSINPYLIASEMTERLCETFSVPDVEVWAKSSNPSGKVGTPQDIANVMINTLDGKYKEKFPSGSSLLTDGHVLFHAREAMDLVAAEKETLEFEERLKQAAV